MLAFFCVFSAFARSSTHITLPFVRHIYCHYLSKISPFLTPGKPLCLVVTFGAFKYATLTKPLHFLLLPHQNLTIFRNAYRTLFWNALLT